MKEETVLQELRARDTIREVINRFAIGVDQRNWDMVASCFTSDADFNSSPIFVGKFKDRLPLLKESMGRFEVTMHFTGTQVIELDGDHAHVETYSIDYHRMNVAGQEKDYIAGVRFIDDLVRQSETWLIERRVARMVWRREDVVALPAGM